MQLGSLRLDLHFTFITNLTYFFHQYVQLQNDETLFSILGNFVFVLVAFGVISVNSITYRIQDTFNPLTIGTDATRLIYQQINIPIIPSGGLFSHLIILERLQFFNTDVTSLEPGAFQGLSALTFLDFSGNSISTLERGVFQGLDSLVELELIGNFLTETSLVSDIWIEVSDTLVVLDLYSNQISYLQKDTFVSFSRLERLYLGSNIISTVENGTFDGLTSLKILDLSRNRISVLSPGSFILLTSLTDLGLSYNLLTVIEPRTFKGLRSLTALSLSNNLLTTLNWNAFEPRDYVLNQGHPGMYTSSFSGISKIKKKVFGVGLEKYTFFCKLQK